MCNITKTGTYKCVVFGWIVPSGERIGNNNPCSDDVFTVVKGVNRGIVQHILTEIGSTYLYEHLIYLNECHLNEDQMFVMLHMSNLHLKKNSLSFY